MTYVNDHLLSRLSQHNTSLTPREIVHLPERVEGQEEGEGGDSEDVEHHPPDHVPLATQDEHKRLKTIDSRNHDDGDSGDALVLACNEVDQVHDLKLWS